MISSYSYLLIRTSTSGETLCFLQPNTHAFYTGIILPYGLAMAAVIGIFVYSAMSIFRNPDKDLDIFHSQKKNFIKMGVLFFTIGVCWLVLIMVLVFSEGTWADIGNYIFVIFKCLQAVVIFVVLVGRNGFEKASKSI